MASQLPDLFQHARDLMSPDGKNVEYDRALVELIVSFADMSSAYSQRPKEVAVVILGRPLGPVPAPKRAARKRSSR